MIPYGGQQLVSVSGWSNETQSWVQLYSASDCEVTYTITPSDPIPYVALQTNPCRTTFRTDTLRLLFDTDLTTQWLMVDAVKLSGTLELPSGAVTNNDRWVIFVPDSFVYGPITFDYTVTDCAYKDERVSTTSLVTIEVAGVSDPPYIAHANFSVKGALFSPSCVCVNV